MKYIVLVFEIVVLFYLGSLTWFLATGFEPALPGYRPPFGLFVMDTINLFIHEAGHAFFKVFGQWIHIVAGSVVQCLLPLALLIVTWRENVSQIAYPAFWLGESMVNVSAYIQDAPYRQLRLIAKGLIHDWWWLLRDNLDLAEPLGGTVYVTGMIICIGALSAGVYFAVRRFRIDAPALREDA
jgi:hypothetical protein